MLIGAHVSPAGGPANAVARGVERGARAIQIFNQNPRAWKPRVYSPEEVEAFRAAMADSDVDALLIHAVYLLNCATEDDEMRDKSRTALIGALRAGAALGGADVEARRVEVAGVQAHPEALVAAGGLDQRGELGERAPQRPARARGVLQVQGAALALGQRLGDDRARALDRRADLAALRRAGVQDDGVRAERRAGLQRRHQRAQRVRAHLGVVGRAVEQVDGVDEQRVDGRVGHRGAKLRDLLVGVVAWLPGPRVLVEDLDRVRAALDPARDRLRRAAGRRDMSADQHLVG